MASVYVDRYGEAWIESQADGVIHYDPLRRNSESTSG